MNSSGSVEVTILAPECLDLTWLDPEVVLGLDQATFARLCDNEGQPNVSEVVGKLGPSCLVDKPWVRVDPKGGTSWTLSSRFVMERLSPSGLFEGLDAYVVGSVVAFIVVTAQGQAGGFSVHRAETGDLLFASSEFVPAALLWVDPPGRVMALEDTVTYSSHAVSLMSAASGEPGSGVTLFASYHLNRNLPTFAPDGFPMTRLELEKAPSGLPAMHYAPDSDELQVSFEENWAGCRKPVVWRGTLQKLTDWLSLR